MMDIEKLAREGHDAYERLAPQFGYETRTDTRKFDPTSPNGRLMMAVYAHVAALVAEACIETVYDATDWAHEETDLSLKEIIAAAIRERFKAS